MFLQERKRLLTRLGYIGALALVSIVVFIGCDNISPRGNGLSGNAAPSGDTDTPEDTDPPTTPTRSAEHSFDKTNLVLEKMITTDTVPSGMTTIPGTTQILLSSRKHRTTSNDPILIVLKDDAQVKSLSFNIPGRAMHTGGQAGVFGIEADPNYATNNYVYLFLTLHDRSDESYANQAVLRLTYNSTTMTFGPISDADIIIEDTNRSSVGKADPNSNGGKLLFLPDGTMLASFGYQYTFAPQSMSSLGGKIIRLFSDGRPVCGDIGEITPNPFCRSDFATDPTPTPQDYVYSMGHKNNQGMTLARGRVIASEHGERAGDEINLITAGGNYGFPYLCNGCRPYVGDAFGDTNPLTDTQRKRITRDFIFPLYTWTGQGPSIAPSGIAFYTHDGPYKNNLIVGSLVGGTLYRFLVDKNFNLVPLGTIMDKKAFRDVMVTDDGAIYVSVHNHPHPHTNPRPGKFVYKFRPVK